VSQLRTRTAKLAIDPRCLAGSHFKPMLSGILWRAFPETDERLLDVIMGENATKEGR
jgi:hypothetical protein